MCSEGEGGTFFFLHTVVFLWEVFFPPSSWTLLLWAGLVERGLWESGVMVDMDTHTFLSHNYLKMMTHLMTHSLFFLHSTQLVLISQYLNSLLLGKGKTLLRCRFWTYLAAFKDLSTSPQSQRRVNLLSWRGEKKNEGGGERKEDGERREPNIGTVFISLCGRLQRDERGQWRERRPFRTNTQGPAWHTHPDCRNLTQWCGGGGIFIFNKATLILGLTFYIVPFILKSIDS